MLKNNFAINRPIGATILAIVAVILAVLSGIATLRFLGFLPFLGSLNIRGKGLVGLFA